MYNFTDANPVIFNLRAEPMHGKLVFLVPGTTDTYVNVEDVEGNNLGHVLVTNQYGRLAQQVIMTATADVQYWEFTGTVFDIEDDTQFTLIRTERILDPQDTIVVDVEGCMSADSTEQLRDIDVTGFSDRKVCLRTGYYVGGDCAPLAYVWDATMSGNDDGGYILKPTGLTGVGRWVAVFPDYIDVRWFGAKGSELRSTVTYQSSAVIAAANRSMLMGKALYFPSTGSNTFYGFDNVSINVGTADIRLDAGVALVGKADTSNSIACHDLYCDRSRKVFLQSGQDRFSVTAHEVWTASLSNYGDITADIVHWNAGLRKTSWSDCEFHVEAKPSTGMTFDNVELSFASTDYLLDNDGVMNSFANMKFTDRYFVEDVLDYGFLTVDDSCTTDIKEFRNPDNWFNCRQELGDTDIDCTDVKMTNVVVKNSMTLHNVNANLLAAGEGVSLTVLGGNLNSLSYTNTTGALALVNVRQTNSSSRITPNALSMNDSMVAATVVTKSLACERSDFSNVVSCNSIVSYSSSFSVGIDVYFEDELRVVMISNYVACKLRISRFSGSTAENVRAVNCVWRGNTVVTSGSTPWIELDRTHLEQNDALHDYVYDGNIGGNIGGSEKYVKYPFGPSTATMARPCLMTAASTNNYLSITWMGSPFTDMSMFTIGTTGVRVKATSRIVGVENTSTMSGEAYQYSVATAPHLVLPDYTLCVGTDDRITLTTTGESDPELVQALEFVSGFSWRINTGSATKTVYGPTLLTLWQLVPSQMINTMASQRIDGRKWTFALKMEKI